MIVAAGSRLGPYEILARLGAGGMGEVWVANDTRLNRRVAIKMISSDVAGDVELQHRFRHEARIISQLSHPNICTLFDVGDDYIVMELLQGETLSSRIDSGPMPLRDVIRYGAEIAEALDAAHRMGVVHRDLKPGNVMLTKNGAKLLDFGLAKNALPPVTTEGATGRLTREGMVVGTPQHMAPEQLEGRPADPRMDIYALGTLLYEMITGRPAFDSSVPMVIAAIMKSDLTPISDLRPDVPPALEHVVRVCMARDPEARWQSAHDVAEQLRWLASGVSSQTAVLSPPKRRRRAGIAAGVAGAVVLAGLIVLAWRLGTRKESLRFSIDLADDVRLIDSNAGGGIDVSPDGRTMVLTGRDAAGGIRLYQRSLDNFATRPLAGTDGASYPFWSPKGDAIAFFAQGKLRRVGASGGGVPVDIADAPDGRGGAWSAHDEIVFSPSITSPLMRVSARGGVVTPVTTLLPGEQTHRFPSLFPDGDHFLYYASANSNAIDGVRLGSLSRHTSRLLLRVPASARAAGDHGVLFVRNGMLMAQEVDLRAMTLVGEPRPIAQNVGAGGDRRYQAIAVSPAGTLVFVAEATRRMHVVIRDRTGRLLGTVGPPGDYHEPVFDPSGKKVLVTEKPPGNPVRLVEIDLQDGQARPVAADHMGSAPVVAPDNSRLLFFLNDGRGAAVFELPRGTSVTQVITRVDGALWPNSITPDGKLVVLDGEVANGRTNLGLWLLNLDTRKVEPLLASAANETHAQLSPDGRLIAYSSDELGQSEIFVQPFPPSGAKWQVSVNGGDQAQWRGDGGEIFYLGPDGRMNVVTVQRNPEFATADPHTLFVTELTPTSVTGDRNQYLVTRDGQRFLLLEPDYARVGPRMNVITNWH